MVVLNQLQFPGMPQPASSPAQRANEPAPTPQRVALQRNRERIAGTTTARTDPVVPVERFGLQTADDPAEGWRRYEDSPNDTFNFRRNADTRWVPLVGPDAARAIQPTVDPKRVKQIAAEPEMGNDPRFPGAELPKAIEFSSGQIGITNGTHRTAADVAYGGRLFGQMRVLPAERISEAPPLMQQAKNLRESIGYERQTRQDPMYGSVRQGKRIR